ncbi:unnamed protein product [Rotaria sp. Silwood2]|nr:unnamed protein product [Rotaria sp. Silwood2]CAF4148101.1 unnamed protein product [Rotaria sp. Silwood2]
MHPVVHHQKSCSLQLVNETTPSVTAVAPSRVFIISAPPTFNLYDEVTAQKSNNSSINNRIHGAILNPSPSVVGIPINKSYLGEVIPTANMRERPYNDDSLLTDSMNTEDEQVLQDIENIPPIDLNSTQISEPADDLVPSLADTGETNSFTNINPNHLASSSNVDAFSKHNTPPITNSSKPKKTAPGKKETNIGNKSGFDTRSDWENRIL